MIFVSTHAARDVKKFESLEESCFYFVSVGKEQQQSQVSPR